MLTFGVRKSSTGQFFNIIVFFLLSAALSACISNKKVVYMQEANEESPTVPNDSLLSFPYKTYVVQPGDNLDIKIKSLDGTTDDMFNIGGMATQAAGQLINNASDIFYLTGFNVDANGMIEVPVIGRISVAGKTLAEVRRVVEESAQVYIKDPYISVKLGGIRFTALGEFRAPGRYGVLQNRLTIYEAIASAGDLQIEANRKEALLIRQYPEGQRIHKIDLTNRDLINSEFYYIQPGDQLYVAPLKVRELGTGITTFQTISAVAATITAVFLILNFFTK
ncbi:Polysaccharide export outer membrane protein [Imperialibacter sp. EC-SDR9]|uniref:polysaccharide biosynthesis/export family protein n=2 Tax=Imperialibacter TaxID=1649461 RepID=UPI0012549737|nr:MULTISPECIES: polysaccharide biosynthesis/export family protein [unclassified Imperialibacter]CAD5252775.1 Polysaccharide export outer membrane protein [Imperialibacter sp. 89]CAD5260923.1 Polysaccharide export outer membrane protein [Imperialibacter sp. 75]VVT03854.1 Polysaccharide export outer membrane protein [Imperialibacter sp. EC-SDR9]